MASSMTRMTKTEFEEIIERSMEHKLLEILGDPDESLGIRRLLQDQG